jgi:WD40 repeat protein
MYRLRHVVAVLLLAIVTDFSLAQQPPKLEMVVQTRHIEDSTRGVAISGDGKLAIIGSWDGTLSLWDAVSGNRIQTYATPNHVTCVALTRDGKRAIACGATEAVLLDTATGKTLQTLKHRPYFPGIVSVALSDDAKFALTSVGGNSSLWDLTTGKAIREFIGAPGALSGDGKLVLVGESRGPTTLWNAVTGVKLHTFKSHRAVALSRDGKRALTELYNEPNKEAILWDTDSGERLQTFAGHDYRVSAGALSGDGKLVLTYSTDKTKGELVILWDADSGKKLHTLFCDANLPIFNNGIDQPGVSMSDDGKFVFVAARQSIGKPNDLHGPMIQRHIVWDTATGKAVQTFQRHTADVASLALSGDGKVLLIGTKDKINVWDTAAGKRAHILDAPGGTVALTRDGKRLLTVSPGTEAVFWDTASGKKLESLPKNKDIRYVRMSSDGESVATSTASGQHIIWRTRAGKFEQAHSFFRSNIVLSGDGKRVFAAGAGGAGGPFNCELWDVPGGKQLGIVKGLAGIPIACNDDGTRLLTISNGLTLWDIDEALTAKKLQSISTFPGSLALSRDAKLLLSGSEKTAILWDAANGKKMQTFAGHFATVTGVLITDDAKQIWTASADGTVRLWDPATGKERCQIVLFKDSKDWLAVSPDGLFDGSADAWRFVTFREPGTSKLLDDDATRRRFHRPGLLGQIIAGKQPK